jgi:hypothetical protein
MPYGLRHTETKNERVENDLPRSSSQKHRRVVMLISDKADLKPN